MHVVVETSDRVALVTLVDPKRRNAMTAAMVDEIVDTFDALEANDDVGAVVLTGEPPAFCSGADVSALGALSEGRDERERGEVRSIYEGFLRVLRSSLPTVAAVNGAAVGAGMNLALACDVRIAGESARFETRFLNIGLHPGGGHTWMLERAVGPQAAAAMVLFGQTLDGPAAVAAGLAWSWVADDVLVATAIEFAAGAAKVPKPLAARTKQTLQRVPWQPDFAAAIAYEVEHQAWSLGQPWFTARTGRASIGDK
ncbi:MAG: enoyl-CoA hydratase/carnithine racemase [Actinomycetia bacterium]|nr:enoyl-CoA hydratase/carnithine racemase [Actinomycetes bacterium]